jgi:hypothetical protein
MTLSGLMLAGLVAGGPAAAELPRSPAAVLGPETTKPATWLEQLMSRVVTYQTLAEQGAVAGDFRPYLGQLVKAREAYRSGDHQGTYHRINEYMVMLETRVGEIDPHVAEALWDHCYQVTPDRYHARDRHVRAHGAEELRKYEEFIRQMEERAGMSF